MMGKHQILILLKLKLKTNFDVCLCGFQIEITKIYKIYVYLEKKLLINLNVVLIIKKI